MSEQPDRPGGHVGGHETAHAGSGKQFADDLTEVEPSDLDGTPEGSGKQFARGQSAAAEPRTGESVRTHRHDDYDEHDERLEH